LSTLRIVATIIIAVIKSNSDEDDYKEDQDEADDDVNNDLALLSTFDLVLTIYAHQRL